MFSYVKIQGDFMKKYLLLAAVLVAQLFTADLPLTARFIAMDDLLDTSPIQPTLKGFVCDGTEEKWIAAKNTMEGQIAQNAMRRVLFFRGEELVTSTRSGRMPLHIYPVTVQEDGAYEFVNGQESIADIYRSLISTRSAVEDAFEKEGFTPGLTWRICENIDNPQEILAVSLIPNAIADASLIAEMHKAAFTLFGGMYITDYPDRLPSLYVSMVQNVAGVEEVDFGENLMLQPGLHNYYPGKEDGQYYVVTGRING